MLRLIRVLLSLTFAWFGAAALSAEEQTPAPARSPQAELEAELASLLQAAWHPSGALRTSVGWRDNILLSPFAPIERGFGRAELDALLLRPMRNGWEFVSFLNGDVMRYLSPPSETRGEQQWSLHAEGRWQPVAPARFSLKGAGYLRDMVIDLSETEAVRVVAPTRVRGAYAVAGTRLAFGRFTLNPSVQAKRTDYRDYPGDYDEVRSGGRLEWRAGEAFAVSAAWYDVRRDYDERPQYTAGGRPLPGTRLRFRQRDGELKVRTAWKRAGQWDLAASAGRLENRDQAYGYFDYNQKRVRLEAGWAGNAWQIDLDAEARRLDYLVQTVGAGIAPPPRISDDYDITLRLERELDDRWTLFGEHRWERSRSNEFEFRYRVNTILAGVQRSL